MLIDLDNVFPIEAPALCSLRGEADLEELRHEYAYEEVKQSPLFDELQNSEVDKAAEQLATHIQKSIDEWFSDSVEIARLKAINENYAHLDETRRA